MLARILKLLARISKFPAKIRNFRTQYCWLRARIVRFRTMARVLSDDGKKKIARQDCQISQHVRKVRIHTKLTSIYSGVLSLQPRLFSVHTKHTSVQVGILSLQSGHFSVQPKTLRIQGASFFPTYIRNY